MCQNVPRWGYNKEMPGKGGGLLVKPYKFGGKENTPTLQKVMETVKGYLQANKKAEAYSHIFNSGLPSHEQNWLINQIF